MDETWVEVSISKILLFVRLETHIQLDEELGRGTKCSCRGKCIGASVEATHWQARRRKERTDGACFLPTLNLPVDFISMLVAAHSLERLGGQCWQIKEVAQEISRGYGSPEDTRRGTRSEDGNYPSTRGKLQTCQERHTTVCVCVCVCVHEMSKQLHTCERIFIDRTKTNRTNWNRGICASIMLVM